MENLNNNGNVKSPSIFNGITIEEYDSCFIFIWSEVLELKQQFLEKDLSKESLTYFVRWVTDIIDKENINQEIKNKMLKNLHEIEKYYYKEIEELTKRSFFYKIKIILKGIM